MAWMKNKVRSSPYSAHRPVRCTGVMETSPPTNYKPREAEETRGLHMPEGSFVRRRFHPLQIPRRRDPRSRVGGSWEAGCSLRTCPRAMNRGRYPKTIQAPEWPRRGTKGTKAEFSFCALCAFSRLIPFRGPGGSWEAAHSFRTCSPDMNQRTARADRGLSARSGASRRRCLKVHSCAADSTRCGPEVRAPGSDLARASSEPALSPAGRRRGCPRRAARLSGCRISASRAFWSILRFRGSFHQFRTRARWPLNRGMLHLTASAERGS